MDLPAYLAARRAEIEAALDAYLPPAAEWPALLHTAMRYSVASGGKRLRPILCLACAEAVGGPRDAALVPAVALEVLHTYTLIHDDLPAMDNDDLRRGRPTAHKAFGEANAILAGDALSTLAFELLARVVAPPPYPPGQLALELAEAAGSRGVAGGQFEDLAAEGHAPDAERLACIHTHKTGQLFRAACRMGAIAAGADAAQLVRLTTYGENLGLAFQIADDVLNVTSSPEESGKAVGSDAARQKLTYAALYGLDASRAKARALVVEAQAALPAFGPRAAPLTALADFAVARSS